MMDVIKMLLVEDDNDFRTVIKDSLELSGEYKIYEAKNGLEGFEAFKTYDLDIIVTDVDMPKVSGLEMVDLIRRENMNIPILITSGLTNSKNVEDGFIHNIDNYIKKPFIPDELDGYIKAIFRRINENEHIVTEKNNVFPIGSYLFDTENRFLKRYEKIINLSKREANMLFMLYSSKGKLVKRKDILKKFWGEENDFFQSRSLDVFMHKLRKYLKDDASIEIVNLRGDGYRLIF